MTYRIYPPTSPADGPDLYPWVAALAEAFVAGAYDVHVYRAREHCTDDDLATGWAVARHIDGAVLVQLEGPDEGDGAGHAAEAIPWAALVDGGPDAVRHVVQALTERLGRAYRQARQARNHAPGILEPVELHPFAAYPLGRGPGAGR